jgi:biopolymer transport protein ExbD
MRKNPYEELETYDEINVVPMLDLAWNLLLVFMIVVTSAVQGISVSLPKASASTSASKVKSSMKAITITADGKIYLDSMVVTMGELEGKLRQLKAATPDFPVVVRGDEKIAYRSIIEVLNLLQQLEITKLGLVTQKIVK